ncbi:uncharacterized protein LOC116423588 [Sarcophilus harrisii]|uniref:uncharacterized protein LOC116423588 n=1 Tax=Sarcophilus harrisii TaxID=9305 RepID=UPI001301F7CC|nr:uncharacterized protein LOC116423588 [Sarcophilus harrisii]
MSVNRGIGPARSENNMFSLTQQETANNSFYSLLCGCHRHREGRAGAATAAELWGWDCSSSRKSEEEERSRRTRGVEGWQTKHSINSSSQRKRKFGVPAAAGAAAACLLHFTKIPSSLPSAVGTWPPPGCALPAGTPPEAGGDRRRALSPQSTPCLGYLQEPWRWRPWMPVLGHSPQSPAEAAWLRSLPPPAMGFAVKKGDQTETPAS